MLNPIKKKFKHHPFFNGNNHRLWTPITPLHHFLSFSISMSKNHWKCNAFWCCIFDENVFKVFFCILNTTHTKIQVLKTMTTGTLNITTWRPKWQKHHFLLKKCLKNMKLSNFNYFFVKGPIGPHPKRILTTFFQQNFTNLTKIITKY